MGCDPGRTSVDSTPEGEGAGMTGDGYAVMLAGLVSAARGQGGGRRWCCQNGPCGTCLAESSAVSADPRGRTVSTLLPGRGVCVVPDHGGQELVGAFGRAVVELSRASLLPPGMADRGGSPTPRSALNREARP